MNDHGRPGQREQREQRDATGGTRRPAGPTRSEIVRGVRRELELAGIEAPGTEAERLVAVALDLPRAALSTEGGSRVDPAAATNVARAVARRIEGQPLQHIEGTVDFRYVRLVSDGRALIPRPETEQLIDRVLQWSAGRGPVGDALDIGVGSGALALALLDEAVAARVVGIDVSHEALALAGDNARAAGAENLELRACRPDVWSALEAGERFDLIVSNPPYVTTDEWRELDPVIRDHEPRIALDGGVDGLDVIRRIVSGAATALREGGSLFLEIGASQGPAVMALLRAEPGLADPSIGVDLAGRTRFASACKAASP